MSVLDLEIIYKQASKLTDLDKIALISKLKDDIKNSKQHKLAELEGLGKEIWETIDTQKYLHDLRREWDER